MPFCLVVYAFFVGHWSGMTPLQTFAVNIFSTVGTPINKYYATILIGEACRRGAQHRELAPEGLLYHFKPCCPGLVELAGTIVCVALVHYTGKRPLALFSTLGAGICFMVTATYVYVQGEAEGGDQDMPQPHAWVPMVALVASALISHTGIRILPWLLIGEVSNTWLNVVNNTVKTLQSNYL